jgi:hypothetical protein
MEIPANWSSSKRQRPSRVRGDVVRKKARWSYESEDPVCLEEMCTAICDNVLDLRRQQVEETLNFDTILSSVPYRQILDTLFGGMTLPLHDVPIVAKKFEETFMRECIMQSERKCVMGNDCECRYIDRDNAFVGVEFLVGSQTVHNCGPQMCVMCSRKYTQKLFYDMLFKPPMSHFGVIQRYGVLNNVDGEYSPEYTLVMPPSGPVHVMPYPSPVHCRNNYRVVVRAATRYIMQKPESAFQRPSLTKPSSA